MGGNTTVFKYDNGGNLQYKKVYAYSAASGKTVNELLNGTTGKTISYGYGVATNKDLLTSYNGSGTLEYDNFGNPQKWFKHGTGNSALIYTLQWGNVSNLISIYDGVSGSTYNYKYNDQGIRTEKVVNGVVHKYYLQGEQIIAERYGSNLIKFYYDTTGVCGFNYNGTDYYYQKNIQGDILRIFNGNGTLCAEYSYDAWGKCTIKSNVSNIATINPFRYRGYYLDDETGLYYLNARYYDPEIGRFISPDGTEYLDPESINGLNIYAYCRNNPVMNIDPSGTFALISFLIGLGIAALIGVGVGAISYTVGAVVSWAISGEWSWSWGMFAGAIIGGALGGALAFAAPWLSVGVSSFITGVLSTSIGMGLEMAWEGAEYTIAEILISSVLSGFISALSAKIAMKIKIPGFTGRGSISQVTKQINTKLYNGTIKHVRIKTISKMFAYESYYSFFNIMAEGIISVYEKFRGVKN